MITIGLNISHEPSAALNIDGRIIAAVEEEKLLQIKSYHGFPRKSLEFVISKLSAAHFDEELVIAIGCQSVKEFQGSHFELSKFLGNRYNHKYLTKDIVSLFFKKKSEEYLKKHLELELKNELYKFGFKPSRVTFSYVRHHRAHALSASVYLNEENIIVVTADGKGDSQSATISIVKSGEYTSIAELTHLQSLGQIYSAATESLGFKSKRHEGKVTGLAASGNSLLFYDFLSEICGTPVEITEDISKIYREAWINSVSPYTYLKFFKMKSFDNLKDFLKFCLQTKEVQIFALGRHFYKSKIADFIDASKISREDVAFGVQKYVEEAILTFVSRNIPRDSKYVVALAGGLFANVRINQEILELENVADVFVQPAMHDAGTSLGSTFFGGRIVHNNPIKLSETAYLGPEFTLHEYAAACTSLGFSLSDTKVDPVWVANEISNGKIVGIFSGCLEWGPRALGNRSILANAGDPKITGELNRRLNRSDFMPFAPMVLDSDAERVLKRYSDEMLAGDFMTCTFEIEPKVRSEISAIVHVDNTARPQVVRSRDNLFIHQILRALHDSSGLGVCINTSFNLHEFPIVNAPTDAIKVLKAGAIDYLIFGQCLVK